MRRPLSTLSVQTRLNIKASVSPISGQPHTGQAPRSEQQSRPQDRVQALEALAANLRDQLQAIDSLIESEKSAELSA